MNLNFHSKYSYTDFIHREKEFKRTRSVGDLIRTLLLKDKPGGQCSAPESESSEEVEEV
jgi:hypothetical protein